MSPLDWINGGWKQDPKVQTIPGVGTGINFDGVYGFQCMDFALAYSVFMGAEFSHGNANVLFNDQKGWTRVYTPEVGDVFCRDAYFGTTNYGDTGLVQSVTSTGVYVVQQNLAANLQVGSPPAQAFWNFSQLKSYLRREISMFNEGDRQNFNVYCFGKDIGVGKGQVGKDWESAMNGLFSPGSDFDFQFKVNDGDVKNINTMEGVTNADLALRQNWKDTYYNYLSKLPDGDYTGYDGPTLYTKK